MVSPLFTPHGLQSARSSWWDDAFTQLLLEAIPRQTQVLIEVDCGQARAASRLLPGLPEARYLGFEARPECLVDARVALEGSTLWPRLELRQGAADQLPLPEATADVVLDLMRLQNRTNVPTVLAELVRVLRPGGRLVAVEPDNLGQRFYFDGALEEVSQAFHALALRARVARQPADIALGPRLPGLMQEAGLLNVSMRPQLVGASRLESAQAFYTRLQRVAETMAQECAVETDDERLGACSAAIRRALLAGLPKRLGHSCHLVPVFLCLGERP